MKFNQKIEEVIRQFAEIAGYLWEKGWAERNGGNISYNITEYIDSMLYRLPPLGEDVFLPQEVQNIANNYFIVTGTGKRMRYIHSDPLENISIIRISEDGKKYSIIADKYIKPTSELPSHLMIHDYLKKCGRNNRVVVHTHPTELVAMTHHDAFLEKDVLTNILWSMIPETRAFCPKGLGIVRYKLPGSVDLAQETIKQLDSYDVVMWEKHGAVAIGENLIEAFDMIDTLSKSAQIYMSACAMGFVPEGMTHEQMDELKKVFGL